MHVHLLLSNFIVLSIYLGSNLEVDVIHFNHMLYEWVFLPPFKQHQSLPLPSSEVLQVLAS